MMLLVLPTAAAGANVVFVLFLFFFAFRTGSSAVFILLLRLSSCLHERSRVALANDEPALLVSLCLTHPLRGWGIVGGCRTKTADRVARYQTD